MRTIDTDERTTMGALDVEECLVLLRWEPIGRLAFGVHGQSPIVVPVNFCVHERTIVFRSDNGTKLDLVREQPVSLQADRFDWFRRIGWSVLVRGTAHEVPADGLADVDLQPWAPGRKAHWVRLVPTAITGRRLDLTEGPLDNRGYA
jgi:nitroimidazol reductase NimA-like FMN-containing flavoprotein (pyridoxamine 5'-phosphate oxidase superfamily)